VELLWIRDIGLFQWSGSLCVPIPLISDRLGVIRLEHWTAR